MDIDRWQRIKTILEQAFDLDSAARDAFLDQTCGDDRALRNEVESLLAAEASAVTLERHLARLPGAMVAAMDGAPGLDSLIGCQVDRYRVLQRIGSGGTATVYLAERSDDHYKQRVALKAIHARDTEDLLLRFRNERQILAGLDHPNIARLLDGGRFEGDDLPDGLRGRPYMVMEFVAGAPIDRYCDTARLTITDRIHLFRTVCEAVQAAHQNLVVHRDLKPGNILVSHEGVVKLLDFGIAKVLNPELSSAALAVTHSDLRLLSPSYASPEQLMGEPITTASDVYSLGVVLFELLCGRLPYRDDDGLQMLVTQILQAERPRLSTAFANAQPDQALAVAASRGASVRHVRRALSRDLEAIVHQALARDPSTRYRSVEALSDDLSRYLDGRAVSAQNNSPFYRLRRWVGRFRIAVSAGTLGLAILIGSLVVATKNARSATDARDAAERTVATATEVTEFVAGIFDSASPSVSAGTTVTARALLDAGARRIEDELDGSPEVKATLLHVIGRAYMSLGLYDEAWRLLGESLTLRQRLLPRGHRDIALTQQLVARALTIRGRVDLGIAMHRESLATLQAESPPDRLEVARGLTLLSYAVGMNGEADEAEDLRRRSLALRSAELGDDHPTVASAWNDLGHVLLSSGRAREAEAALRQALVIRRAQLGDLHPDVATTLGNLARTHLAAGRLADAESAAQEALAIAQQVFDPSHVRLAISRDSAARVHLAAGRIDEAEVELRQALDVFERTYPAGNPRMALTWGLLAEVALARGDTERAGNALAEASRIMGRVAPAQHLYQPELKVYRGRWLLAVGRHLEAETELLDAIGALRENQWPASVALRQAAQTMAELYEITGRDNEALALQPLTELPKL